MKKLKIILSTGAGRFRRQRKRRRQDAGTNSAAWLTQPLSLMGALNIALQQNAAILKGKNDLEASYGIVVQTRAVALPQVQATGKYTDSETRRCRPPFPAQLSAGIKTGTRACKSSNPFTTAEN